MPDERWLPVSGTDGKYEVSNLGRVRSIGYRGGVRNRIFRTRPSKRGYVRIIMTVNGKERAAAVHRLVLEAFLPQAADASWLPCNHLNGIKSDNRLENLEWSTPKDNTAHAHANGLIHPARGAACPQSKLSAENIPKIRALYATGEYTQKELGEMFGVARESIRQVLSGRSWSHVVAADGGSTP